MQTLDSLVNFLLLWENTMTAYRRKSLLAYNSRGIRLHHGGRGMEAEATGAEGWALIIFKHMQEAERGNWKWGTAMNSESPSDVIPQGRTHLLSVHK